MVQPHKAKKNMKFISAAQGLTSLLFLSDLIAERELYKTCCVFVERERTHFFFSMHTLGWNVSHSLGVKSFSFVNVLIFAVFLKLSGQKFCCLFTHVLCSSFDLILILLIIPASFMSEDPVMVWGGECSLQWSQYFVMIWIRGRNHWPQARREISVDQWLNTWCIYVHIYICILKYVLKGFTVSCSIQYMCERCLDRRDHLEEVVRRRVQRWWLSDTEWDT